LSADDESDMMKYGEKQKGSILAADDDKHDRNLFLAITDNIGYNVVVAENGDYALDLFLNGTFDLVFTALKLSGMDGLTLSLQVKASSPNTPFVLILDENIKNAMSRIQAGRIDCVLSKPLSSEKIKTTVQYFVSNRSPVPG
jgi:two-component system, autoinducer 1 sensor kinase/phosphatase LuxN